MSDDTKPRCGETSTDLSWHGDDRMRRCEREPHADNTHECSRPDGSLYWWTVFPGIVAAVTVGVDHGAPGGDRSVVSTVHQTAAGAMLLSTVVAPKPKAIAEDVATKVFALIKAELVDDTRCPVCGSHAYEHDMERGRAAACELGKLLSASR